MKFLSVALLTVMGILCFGADGDAPQGPPGDWGGQGGPRGRGQRGGFGGQRGGGNFGGPRGGFGGGMMQNQFFTEVEIAKKFPAEYAELEKMREAYEAALSALAAKAGVELPASRDAAFRKLRKADPAAFDAAVEKMKTSPRDGFTALNELAQKHGIQLFGGMRGGMNNPQSNSPGANPVRQNSRPDLQMLRRKYPEKMQEYDALRAKDPEKAKKLLLEIIELDQSEKK